MGQHLKISKIKKDGIWNEVSESSLKKIKAGWTYVVPE